MHHKNEEWLSALKVNTIILKQRENLRKTRDKILLQIKRMPNWNSPGLGGIERFWTKKSYINVHWDRLQTEKNVSKKSGSPGGWLLVK